MTDAAPSSFDLKLAEHDKYQFQRRANYLFNPHAIREEKRAVTEGIDGERFFRTAPGAHGAECSLRGKASSLSIRAWCEICASPRSGEGRNGAVYLPLQTDSGHADRGRIRQDRRHCPRVPAEVANRGDRSMARRRDAAASAAGVFAFSAISRAGRGQRTAAPRSLPVPASSGILRRCLKIGLKSFGAAQHLDFMGCSAVITALIG